jgi:hypothetical protein
LSVWKTQLGSFAEPAHRLVEVLQIHVIDGQARHGLGVPSFSLAL